MSITFTAVYKKVPDSDWYAAWIEEVPGANTQGQTLEQARENLRDAVALLFETRREMGQEQTVGLDVIREPFVLESIISEA